MGRLCDDAVAVLVVLAVLVERPEPTMPDVTDRYQALSLSNIYDT